MTVATDSVCVLSIEFMVRTHQLGCYGLPKSDPFWLMVAMVALNAIGCVQH